MKTMYFDNGCRVCRAGALLAGKAGMAGDSELNELQTMSAEVSCDLDAVRYCNEIAVYDKENKESRYGIKGMVWFVEDKWGKWINVFLLPVIYQIFNFLYHVFSYNRRMIVPVYGDVENDCKPQFHWGYRLAYVFIVLLLVWLFTEWLFFAMILPSLLSIFLIAFLTEKQLVKMDYVGHLTTIFAQQLFLVNVFMFVAGLCAVVLGVGYFFFLSIASLLVIIFYLFTFYVHDKRIRYLGLNRRLSFLFILLTFVSHAILILMLL
jgi:hypothetical protein